MLEILKGVKFPSKNKAKLFYVRRKDTGAYLKASKMRNGMPQWVEERSRGTAGWDTNSKMLQEFMKAGLFKADEIWIDVDCESGWV